MIRHLRLAVVTPHEPPHLFVRLVPETWRWAHRLFADLNAYFWLPCSFCDRPFGGHEWRDINGNISSIPDPFYPEGSGRSIGICPPCTRAGCGVRVTPAVMYIRSRTDQGE